MKKTDNGSMLIELLLVLAIIAFIVLKVLNNYYKKPFINKETQKVMSEQGIDTASYGSIKYSVKNKLQNIKGNHQEELDKIEQ